MSASWFRNTASPVLGVAALACVWWMVRGVGLRVILRQCLALGNDLALVLSDLARRSWPRAPSSS